MSVQYEDGKPVELSPRNTSLKQLKMLALGSALAPIALLAGASGAQAGIQAEFECLQERCSYVSGSTSGSAPNVLYEFTVHNLSPIFEGTGINVIVDWELPIFDVNDVSNIQSPVGWTHEIIANPLTNSTEYYNNPDFGFGLEDQEPGGYFGQYSWEEYNFADDPQSGNPPGSAYGLNPEVFLDPPFIIHWYTLSCFDPDPTNNTTNNATLDLFGSECGDQLTLDSALRPIEEEQSLSGFSFVSNFGSTNAPYLASWLFEPPTAGDPPTPANLLGLPNSPAFQATQNIPEPGTMTLLGIGVLGTAVALRRRRRKAA